MSVSRRLLVLCVVASLGAVVSSPAMADLVYNFDTPGTEANNGGHGDGLQKQGWTDTIGTSRESFTIAGGRTAVVPGNNQDAQNDHLVFSSPAFVLTPGGAPVTVDLAGGMGNGPDPVSAGNLPTNLSSITAGPSGTDPTDVLVLGLREVSSGNYVSFLQKNQLGDSWTGYSWDLSAFANGSTAYQIDQIDTRQGGWGHIEIDNVVISGTPVPEPGTLVLSAAGLAGLLAAARRRKA